jgi:subfamily B ATP-binding cassette protein MsbA
MGPPRHWGRDPDHRVSFSWALYRRLLARLRPYWKLALAASILVLLGSPLSLGPVEMMRIGINRALGGGAPRPALFLLLALGFIVFSLLSAFFGFGQSYLSAKLGQQVVLGLRDEIYRHLQRLPLAYYESRQTGEIMSRATADIEALEFGLALPVTTIASTFVMFAAVAGRAWLLNPGLTLLALVMVPGLLALTTWFGHRIRRRFREARDARGELSGMLQDDISGIREVQAFVREEDQFGRYSRQNLEVMAKNLAVARLFSFFRPAVGFLTSIGLALVLLYGGLLLSRGKLVAGDLVAFIMYANLLYGPIMQVSMMWDGVQRAVASGERVFEVLDTRPEIQDAPDAAELPRLEGRVEFQDVSFTYQGEGEGVLHDVSLIAEPGMTIALVGPSGGGKTTVAKLIPRFYDPTEGRVLVDGHDLRTVKLQSLRRQIGVVFQETFLFNGSVKDNIAFGSGAAEEEDVIEAAKLAGAHDFIAAFPQGYDTQVGERGVKLSGGERQRIAIARAILSNPRLLILDEATSSVDTATERAIQQALERLQVGRTSFVIAHRLSTVLRADLILVLEGGRVLERGAHAQLLAQGGVYANLYHLQFQAAAALEAQTQA